MRVPPGFRSARRRRDGERGVVLILTLMVLMITVAMVTQLSIGASVAWNATRYRTDKARMELACKAASQEVLQLLLDDLAGADAASGFGDAMGASGFGPPPQDPGAGGEEAGRGEEEEAPPSDSLEDAWAKEMRISVGDIEIRTLVQDENGKFCVHRILSGDEEQQEEERERMVRILDAMRDGMEGDLAEPDARRVVQDLVTYLDRRRRSFEFPAPERQSVGEEDDYLLLDNLEEMLILESVDESIFYDQLLRDEIIAPGLESVLTCYLHPAFEAAGGAGGLDGAGDAAAAAAAADPGAGDSGDTSFGEGGLDGVLEAEAPIGDLVNLNTAPRAVLEGMFPSWQLAPSMVEELIRWRNEVDEEALEQEGGQDVDPEARELQRALYGDLEEDPKQYFSSLEDVAQVPGFDPEELDPETQQALQEQFGVESDVFTVYLWARVRRDDGWEQERWYQTPPGQSLRLRAVVWRVNTANGPKLVFLRPWHEVPHLRWRIPDYQRELPRYRAPEYR